MTYYEIDDPEPGIGGAADFDNDPGPDPVRQPAADRHPMRRAMLARFVPIGAVAAALAIVGGAAFWAGESASDQEPAAVTSPLATTSSGTAVTVAQDSGQELTTVEVVQAAEPAVVRIETSSGVGSGFIIDAGGYIITNNHVIATTRGRTATTITVTLADGGEYAATVVGTDAQSDLAVLKIDPGSTRLTALPLADLDTVEIGDDVVAIGYALDLEGGEGASASVTTGIVSQKNRTIDEAATILGAIQTDAALNGGNSGGPLLNHFGEVIGVNTAGATDPTSGDTANGIGFAIGSDTVRAVYDQIRANGSVERGFLGIQGFEALRPVQAEALGLPADTEGIYLSAAGAVVTSGPAAQAGLQSGDVVLSIDGTTVANESDLAVAMIEHRPGTTVELKVFRAGQELTLEVTLGSSGV